MDSQWRDGKENLPITPHFLIVRWLLFALRQNWCPDLKLSRARFISNKNQADLSHKALCCRSPLPITQGIPSSATCHSSPVPVDEFPVPSDLVSSLRHPPCIPAPSPQDTHSSQGGAPISNTFLPLLVFLRLHTLDLPTQQMFIHSFRLTSLLMAPKCLTKNI